MPLKNVLFTVENTDPACYWLTSYVVNFRGTDTMAAICVGRQFYNCPMAGHSVPAAEHSSITSWERSGEVDAYANMLKQFPNGAIAVVSDSFDVFKACREMWGGTLKEQVIERGKRGGILVVRPDSGDPAPTVCKVLDILGERFGTSTNGKGYKMLPNYLRVIQGDGISLESLNVILEAMKAQNWSAENLSFGSGGALLQRLHRDTLKIAYKCSMIEANGKVINVFKDPITDPGKKSKKGRLSVELQDGQYVTMQEGSGNPEKDLLITVFENGKLTKEWSLDEIRERVDSNGYD